MRRRVSEAKVGRFGTIDDRGRVHLVPFVYVLDGDTVYHSVDDKPKSSARLKRIRNIERDPRVTILVDHYEDDWPAVWWVRLRGTGRVVDAGSECERAMALLDEKYPQRRGGSEQGAVIAVDVEDWLGWSYS